MDYTQILLFVVVSILTLLLVGVGIQVFLILKSVKKTVEKANKILEDAAEITHSVARPVVGVAHFVDGLKSVKDIVEMVVEKSPVGRIFEDVKEEVEDVTKLAHSLDEKPKNIQHHVHALQERGRRFFHKGGKQLS